MGFFPQIPPPAHRHPPGPPLALRGFLVEPHGLATRQQGAILFSKLICWHVQFWLLISTLASSGFLERSHICCFPGVSARPGITRSSICEHLQWSFRTTTCMYGHPSMELHMSPMRALWWCHMNWLLDHRVHSRSELFVCASISLPCPSAQWSRKLSFNTSSSSNGYMRLALFVH